MKTKKYPRYFVLLSRLDKTKMIRYQIVKKPNGLAYEVSLGKKISNNGKDFNEKWCENWSGLTGKLICINPMIEITEEELSLLDFEN